MGGAIVLILYRGNSKSRIKFNNLKIKWSGVKLECDQILNSGMGRRKKTYLLNQTSFNTLGAPGQKNTK